MKFWLFAGERYAEFVSGAMNDYISSHDTLEKAKMAFNFCEKQEWGEIWEVENNELGDSWDWDSDKQEWTK